MDRAKRREIARKGGKAAHAQGSAHEWDVGEARAAGLKGAAGRHARQSRQPPPPIRVP